MLYFPHGPDVSDHPAQRALLLSFLHLMHFFFSRNQFVPGDGAHEGAHSSMCWVRAMETTVQNTCTTALLPKTPILVPIIINTLIAFIMGGQVMAASSDILRAISHLSCSASVNFLQKHKG